MAGDIGLLLFGSECESDENVDTLMNLYRDDDVGSVHRLFASNARVLRSRLRSGRLWRKVNCLWTQLQNSLTLHFIFQTRYNSFWEKELQENSEFFFKENLRLSRSAFHKLCEKLQNLKKENTRFRESISLEKRVAVALYALGSSAEYRTVANVFGIGRSTVGKLLIEFCEEVWRTLQPEYLNGYPVTAEKLKECVKGFEEMGLPQCFASIDKFKFF